jgi:hypothetical protein
MFKKEFTEEETKQLERAINRHTFGADFTITHGSPEHNQVDTFGCPYTSSSDFAGLWNTNTETINRNGEYLQGFVIDEAGELLALYTDKADTYNSTINLKTGEYNRL